MINNLHELNDKINSFVNYVVKTACEKTMSGNYYVSIDDACAIAGFDRDDYSRYRDLVFAELDGRVEILDFNHDENELDLNCALDYCPNYQWQAGDEELFRCSYEEWLNSEVKPVAQPLSLSRMAEIGDAAIGYVFETSDIAVEDLTESIGMSVSELGQLGIYSETTSAHKTREASIPILFFVTDANKTYPYGFVSFEEAFSAFDKLGPGADKAISYSRTPEGETSPRGGLLLKHYPASGINAPVKPEAAFLGEPFITLQGGRAFFRGNPIDELAGNDPYIQLAYSKAYISCYPFDERVWKMRDEAEKALGITDRVVDLSNDLLVGKWRVHVVPTGGHYGLHNALVNEREPLVEFYDMSQDKTQFPDGQFASSYLARTFAEKNEYFDPERPVGLCLDGSIPSWTVSGEEMREVASYLQKTLSRKAERTEERKPSLAERIRNSEELAAKTVEKESALPEQCYIFIESENVIGMVRKGERGYFPSGWEGSPESNRSTVDMMNEKLGVTKAQAAAMKAGSMLGWDVPAANPKNYNQAGEPIRPKESNYFHSAPDL